jgi:glycerol-3-phosphate dehydrogenase
LKNGVRYVQATDIVVVGGGVTGLGVAWDLALRGVRVTLAEQGGVVTGTSGRYHGLLHSGARYVTSDQESARECAAENAIIKRIAPAAVEDTGGLFVLAPGDDPAFVERWLAGCAQAGVAATEVPVAAALRREPVLHPGIERAFTVPDATCDPVRLGASLRDAATAAGATILSYHRVTQLHRQGDTITGARLHDLRSGAEFDIACAIVVNASGPWSAQIGALAGVEIQMALSRGAMVAFNGRWTDTVLSRLRHPGDGDIFLPLRDAGVAGTTSVPTDDPSDPRIEPWEVARVRAEVEAFVPALRNATVLRLWAGVRPLYDPGIDADRVGQHVDGRAAARTFDVLDHHERDQLAGFVTITGGKLTNFRQMAERTSDLVAARLGNRAPCHTAETVLP